MAWIRFRSRPQAVPGVAPGQARSDPSVAIAIREILDPVLVPLRFAPGQVALAEADGRGIFCRGNVDSPDAGCVDLVLDLGATPEWHVTDVRYWGFPADRWHLAFDALADLPEQLRGLARTLPSQLR